MVWLHMSEVNILDILIWLLWGLCNHFMLTLSIRISLADVMILLGSCPF
jgi:hypothetical protein